MTLLCDNTKTVEKLIHKHRYSEIFGRTIQGEGFYTGHPTVWVRWWGCNFSCKGFGQAHLPKEQWVDPYANVDVTAYKSMEELPVFPLGCDSGYSWSKKFSHLAHQGTVSEISSKLRDFLPGRKFIHPKSKQDTHLALTGGEPMISQNAIAELMEYFITEGDVPNFVTIETNGTRKPREPFLNFFGNKDKFTGELFWSVSPKLATSGEDWNKAILPEVVQSYNQISNKGQLKYVCDGSDQNWDEVEKATDLYRKAGIEYPVWIMPVGATREEQEDIQAKVSEAAIDRGYNVAARLHVWLFGNIIGK